MTMLWQKQQQQQYQQQLLLSQQVNKCSTSNSSSGSSSCNRGNIETGERGRRRVKYFFLEDRTRGTDVTVPEILPGFGCYNKVLSCIHFVVFLLIIQAALGKWRLSHTSRRSSMGATPSPAAPEPFRIGPNTENHRLNGTFW